MKIVSLELKNFRNYSHALVKFKDGLNVLYGKNASGKTNMLESVYLCSIFHSPRTTKDKEMILMGESKAQVKIVLESKFRRHTINLQIDEQGKKKVAVENLPASAEDFWTWGFLNNKRVIFLLFNATTKR